MRSFQERIRNPSLSPLGFVQIISLTPIVVIFQTAGKVLLQRSAVAAGWSRVRARNAQLPEVSGLMTSSGVTHYLAPGRRMILRRYFLGDHARSCASVARACLA
jgi:hypothetical protein